MTIATPTPPATVAANPTIPLTPASRLYYQLLYNKLQAALNATDDLTVWNTLLDSRDDVNDILTKDAMYHLQSNTDAFDAMLKAVNDTNADLVGLKAKIAAVAEHIATAADILAAIDKVLTIVPGV